MRNIECYDHLGNRFNSIADMCKHWGINIGTYKKRVELGWSIEKILTTPVKASKPKEIIRDHLGNRFTSVSAMCKYYNIGVTTYKSRIKSGWDLERALTTTAEKSQIYCIDHEGNKFESIADMCRYYNISECTYRSRIKNGWSLEKALTTPIKQVTGRCKDHLGNSFESISEMCKYYGINVGTYMSRMDKGWSLEKALTTPIKQVTGRCKDHLGNSFKSVSEMCRYWGIDRTLFDYRLKNGWGLKEALTTPSYSHCGCKDHLGKEYRTIDNMCKAYGITKSAYKNRIKKGWSLKDTLTTPLNEANRRHGVSDHLGNHYPNIRDMCKHYNRSVQTFLYRIRQGWSLESALTDECGSSAKVNDGFGNSSCSFTELAVKYETNYGTLRDRVKRGIEVCVALICKEYVELCFIGLDGKARYKLNWSDEPQTARQVIEYYRPDLLSDYDKHNHTGKYESYKEGNIDGR